MSRKLSHVVLYNVRRVPRRPLHQQNDPWKTFNVDVPIFPGPPRPTACRTVPILPRSATPNSLSDCSYSSQVRHAKRLSDNERVVIKIRNKLVSFKDAADMAQWTASMEQLINWRSHFGETIAAIYDVFEDSRDVVCVRGQK